MTGKMKRDRISSVLTLSLIALTIYLFYRRRRRVAPKVMVGRYYCTTHEGFFVVVGAPDVAYCPLCTETFDALERELL